MVGGVNSPVRSFRLVGGHPLVMKSGQGSQLFDEDQNAYTDYCLSWGSLILGHSHKDIVQILKKAIVHGTSFGTTTSAELEIAKFITKNIPSIERVRFVNSGTEATMSAIRVARGFTKKEKIIKFDGCYHGHFDDLLTKAGSGVANLSESSSLGITKNHIQNTFSLPFNDSQTFEKIVTQHKAEIACVIIEPVAGNMGVIPAKEEFLKTIRQITQKNNIVLIFDEIMTGFRSHIGGVQSELGVIPDMTCLGKIIGGGFPVGAYGGKREIMSYLAPLGGVNQAGTFAGNPVVMQVGLATLKNLTPSFYKKLNAFADQFAQKLNAFFQKNQIEAFLSHYKSMMSLRFRKKPVANYEDAVAASSQAKYSKVFHQLLRHQIYWPPADLEAFFLSGSHTQADLNVLYRWICDYFSKN